MRAPCTSLLELGRVAILHSKALPPSMFGSGDFTGPHRALLASPLPCCQLGYSPSCCLIASSTLVFLASRLKEAGACIGGNSMADCASLATACCTLTNRQNSRAKKSFV